MFEFDGPWGWLSTRASESMASQISRTEFFAARLSSNQMLMRNLMRVKDREIASEY
jgi:predicted secreted hydrolase